MITFQINRLDRWCHLSLPIPFVHSRLLYVFSRKTEIASVVHRVRVIDDRYGILLDCVVCMFACFAFFWSLR